MLKISVKNNVKFPEVTLQEELEYAAREIIIHDLVRGIDTSTSIEGTPLPPNEPETSMRKAGIYTSKLFTKKGTQRKGFSKKLQHVGTMAGALRPLIETGKLKASFFYKVLSKSKVKVSISSAGNRLAIGGYLQDGIMTKRGLKQYRFFGITKWAEHEIVKYIETIIKKRCQSGKT